MRPENLSVNSRFKCSRTRWVKKSWEPEESYDNDLWFRRVIFWPDEVIETRRQDFEVQYLSLSQRYAVRNVNEQSVNSYATLFSALRYLGEVRDFVIIGNELGSKLQRYEFSLRAVLDWEKLPGPLAMLTFWRGDFSLESDWYRWTPKE